MERQDIFKTLAQYKKVLEEKGYQVIYIGLYGSQNYNVDDEMSDIDAKAIVLPTLHDIIFRKVVSKTIELENGAIDVKDLITFYEVIRKGNFSYVEAIDTEYSIGDKYIKELFSQIRPNLKSIKGAMHEKRKALTHEYPSKHAEFEKWGFDPKQYHHIYRLYHLLERNTDDDKNRTDIYSFLYYGLGMREIMIGIKRNKDNLDIEHVIKDSDRLLEKAGKLIPEDYVYEPVDLSNEVNDYIEKHIRMSLINNGEYTAAREVRTFDNGVPKKDLEKFKALEKYKDDDISYIVYESLEIL